MSETKEQLRQRIAELEEKIEQARTYTDSSPFECPLCSEINPETQTPYHYCSLHLQLAKAEKDTAFFAGNS
jgi:cell division septum initiation protein DivIVA